MTRFASMLLLLSMFTAGAMACLSPQLRDSMLHHTRQVALSFGMTPSQADCLYDTGARIDHDTLHVDGEQMMCYNHRRFAEHMSRALLSCLQLVQQPSVRTSASATVDATHPSLLNEARMVMVPDRVQQLACDCESGCNFCCVLVDIDGEEHCFESMCPLGNGFCSNEHLTSVSRGAVRTATDTVWTMLRRWLSASR